MFSVMWSSRSSPPSDNVHYQHTMQLAEALTEADVQFRMQVREPASAGGHWTSVYNRDSHMYPRAQMTMGHGSRCVYVKFLYSAHVQIYFNWGIFAVVGII